ncbi:hypothetical protein B0H17DRAFT_1149926 [Mycena rosella]|uniref:Uncharacterized protein n=1 Tax=Mycena rosella TaxID=1033263 RepID=A0AAD7BXW8_MYCRO|nr:hypothetical protein B0H17DRAFT_1149926 [Mycena rosella]
MGRNVNCGTKVNVGPPESHHFGRFLCIFHFFTTLFRKSKPAEYITSSFMFALTIAWSALGMTLKSVQYFCKLQFGVLQFQKQDPKCQAELLKEHLPAKEIHVYDCFLGAATCAAGENLGGDGGVGDGVEINFAVGGRHPLEWIQRHLHLNLVADFHGSDFETAAGAEFES